MVRDSASCVWQPSIWAIQHTSWNSSPFVSFRRFCPTPSNPPTPYVFLPQVALLVDPLLFGDSGLPPRPFFRCWRAFSACGVLEPVGKELINVPLDLLAAAAHAVP